MNTMLLTMCAIYKQMEHFSLTLTIVRASQGALMVKNLPAVQETQVRSLGEEDPLEKEMAPHSFSTS